MGYQIWCNMKCLFVGGPKDGERIDVNIKCEFIQVAEQPSLVPWDFKSNNPVKITYTTIVYRRETIRYHEFHWLERNDTFIYVKQGLNFGCG